MQLSKQGIETLEQRRVLSGVPFTGLTLESPGLTEINRLSQDAVDVGDINGDGRVDVLAYSIQSSKLFSMFREENGELGQPKVVAEDFGVLTLSPSMWAEHLVLVGMKTSAAWASSSHGRSKTHIMSINSGRPTQTAMTYWTS